MSGAGITNHMMRCIKRSEMEDGRSRSCCRGRAIEGLVAVSWVLECAVVQVLSLFPSVRIVSVVTVGSDIHTKSVPSSKCLNQQPFCLSFCFRKSLICMSCSMEVV